MNTNTGTLQDLMARVDVILAINSDNTAIQKPGWEIIADVRRRIADSMLDDNGRTVPDMPARVQAYFDLAWLQEQLMNQERTCAFPCYDEQYPCGKASVAFCESCGMEICPNHAERQNGRTLCSGCEGLKEN